VKPGRSSGPRRLPCIVSLIVRKSAPSSSFELGRNARRSRLPKRSSGLKSAGVASGFAFAAKFHSAAYIADFAALAAKLVVEVDGAYHSRCQSADARRDRNLRRLGYRVLRIEAGLVEQHLELAVARIHAALGQ
jgi:very-short-patch-repair endonuclease